MHILIALTYYRPHYSGLTIYAERQARALAERGHQVTILTSRFNDSLPSVEKIDGIEVIRPKVWLRISKGVLMPSMPYWAWILAQKADVVQLHVPQLDSAPISILCKLLAKPMVLTYHCDLRLPGGLVHRMANVASNLANHIAARNADVIVHNSRDYAESSPFLRRYLHKVRTVFPPVEIEPITQEDIYAFRQKYSLHPGQRLIGMAARLATEKGVEFLAQALPQVLEKHPKARVLFVGPYKDVVGEEEYAARLMPLIQGLGDHWTFLGVVSPVEMAVFFKESEVTVLPSINPTESFGIVQVESISCGTPVIASDLSGVRIPVMETGAGLIVPPADSQTLAKALIEVLDNPAAYLGQPERLTHLSTPRSVAVEYEAIFESCLERKKGMISRRKENSKRI